jgi:hypothetical protein
MVNRLILQIDRGTAGALFGEAVASGMYVGIAPVHHADEIGERAFLHLDLVDALPLFSLRQLLLVDGSVVPDQVRSLLSMAEWRPLEQCLRPSLEGRAHLSAIGELSGEAIFFQVQAVPGLGLYEHVKPVVDLWARLLDVGAFPYVTDSESRNALSTDGIEVYEWSDDTVEVATTGYGGGEEGIAALLNGVARTLELLGQDFRLTCWSA